MSYTDDEEFKIGDPAEEDLDLDADVIGPLDDDLVTEDDVDELSEEFADLDGSSY